MPVFRIINCKEGKTLSLEKSFWGHSGKVFISRRNIRPCKIYQAGSKIIKHK
jgi:hypothetical protein